MKKALVIQLARLGDLVQTLPLLHRLKSEAGWEVAIAADSRLKEIPIDSIPVDKMIPIDFPAMAGRKFNGDLTAIFREFDEQMKPLREDCYDIVYNLNRSTLSGLILSQINAREVKGFIPAGKSGDFRYPPYMRLLFNQGHHRRFARIHIADIFRQHAGKLYPLPHPLWKVAESGGDFAGRFINPIRNKGFEHIIAVHPGAGAEIRRWGDEKYIDLITILSRKISPAFILIGTDRTENTAIIKSLPKNIEILDLSGQTTIAELAGVLASSDLFIGADSGPLQLAAAAGTRTLGLFFASAQVHETGPLGDGHIVIQAYPYCAPCREDEPACGNEITCRNMIPPGFAAETALSILEDDVDRISEIEIPKDVLLCKSRYDESGQTYDVLNEGWYDSAGFYRGLWTELLSGNGKTGYKPSSRMNSVKFERLISELAKDPLTLPLANHYLMVKADEGEAEAERQITTAVEYIKNIPV